MPYQNIDVTLTPEDIQTIKGAVETTLQKLPLPGRAYAQRTQIHVQGGTRQHLLPTKWVLSRIMWVDTSTQAEQYIV
uniref:Uncharacterized protein n=1 Tax=Candidatus Kentrum sp. MB TaxID=2138164 RepID=A0A451B8A6_9GAMM|nr:MAG: hypothetical protein BECKMB1821H_GA0114242_100566 [Candidatus Kentron sp. MB]